MDLGLGPAWGSESEYPAEIIALSWGRARGMPPGGVYRNGNLKFCSKPLPVFKQFKAMKAPGEKGRLDLDSKQTISLSVCCALPPYPLPDCYTDTHLPLYLCPFVPPHGTVGWWKGIGDPQHQYLSSPSVHLFLCSRLTGMYPQASRGVSVAASEAPLGCQPLIPSVSR